MERNANWNFHPDGNLVHKHKTKEFDVVEERPAKKYIKISRKD